MTTRKDRKREMSTEASVNGPKPLGVFKAVYLILLAFGLYSLGIRLVGAQPIYVTSFVGEGDYLVAKGVYLFMLFAAGLFVFAAYLSFEAFEHQQGPYADSCMPKRVLWRFVELTLRFFLVATLTVKLWQPSDDGALTSYVAIVAISLLLWTSLVRSKYGAAIDLYELFGNAALAVFSLILLLFSLDIHLATHFSLGAVLVLLLLSIFLVITAGLILNKVSRPIIQEIGEARRKFFADAGT